MSRAAVALQAASLAVVAWVEAARVAAETAAEVRVAAETAVGVLAAVEWEEEVLVAEVVDARVAAVASMEMVTTVAMWAAADSDSASSVAAS